MDIDAIKKQLDTRWTGRRIRFTERVDSTNSWAKRALVEGDARRGDVFICDFQTAGYGRSARPWASAPGDNILMSFIDEPARPATLSYQLALVAGVAFADALMQAFPPIPVKLKWPNDLYVGDAKLGGILCELHGAHVVIGAGINVGSHPKLTPSHQAVSLNAAVGDAGPREDLIAALLGSYERWRDAYARQGLAPITEFWEKYSYLKNKRVKTSDGARTIVGSAQGLDPRGFLVVDSGGIRHTFSSQCSLLLT